MPQPKRTVPSAQKLIRIDAEVLAGVEFLLLDPVKGKPKHGAFSKLTERLLREWLHDQRKEHRNATS